MEMTFNLHNIIICRLSSTAPSWKGFKGFLHLLLPSWSEYKRTNSAWSWYSWRSELSREGSRTVCSRL